MKRLWAGRLFAMLAVAAVVACVILMAHGDRPMDPDDKIGTAGAGAIEMGLMLATYVLVTGLLTASSALTLWALRDSKESRRAFNVALAAATSLLSWGLLFIGAYARFG